MLPELLGEVPLLLRRVLPHEFVHFLDIWVVAVRHLIPPWRPRRIGDDPLSTDLDARQIVSTIDEPDFV
jgi:hypothetical protein